MENSGNLAATKNITLEREEKATKQLWEHAFFKILVWEIEATD